MKKKSYLNQTYSVCMMLIFLLCTHDSSGQCSIVANGPTSICEGGSVQLCASAGANYLWNTGQTTQCITVNVSGSYSVNINGCAPNPVQVTVYTPPFCSITGNNNICQGQSTGLCAPQGEGYSYIWSTGATTTCINANAAGNYSVTITNADGCSSLCSKPVTISPPPSCNISGTSKICSGDSTVLCAPSGNSLSYIWSTGRTTQCMTANAAGTYSLVVTNTAGCSSSCSKTVTVNQGSTSETKIAHCDSYTWHHKIYTKSGTYSFNASPSADGCDSTAILILAISKNLPAEPGAIKGSTHVCPSAAVTYSITAVSGATSYLWTVPAHVSIVSGQGSTSIKCNFTSAANGNITVKAVNGCGSSAARKLAMVASSSFCARLIQSEQPGVSETGTVIYPNPTNGLVTVKFNCNVVSNYNIKLFDMTGKLVKSEEANAIEGVNLHVLDLGNLAKGIYMISLDINGADRQLIRVALQ